jgi:hypothetical protein
MDPESIAPIHSMYHLYFFLIFYNYFCTVILSIFGNAPLTLKQDTQHLSSTIPYYGFFFLDLAQPHIPYLETHPGPCNSTSSLHSPMSSGGIRRIPNGMSEFHGIPTETSWLEPQPFWFSIPRKFQWNRTESARNGWNLGASRSLRE